MLYMCVENVCQCLSTTHTAFFSGAATVWATMHPGQAEAKRIHFLAGSGREVGCTGAAPGMG